ncbi:hypothetical protein IAU59_005921 [Kwoniella sp. CBS 9459]
MVRNPKHVIFLLQITKDYVTGDIDTMVTASTNTINAVHIQQAYGTVPGNPHDPTSVAQQRSDLSPSGREILGHSNEANRSAAASFKAMLEDIAPPASTSQSLSPISPTSDLRDNVLKSLSTLHSQIQPGDGDLLSKAFKREYSADWKSRGIEHLGRVDPEAVRTMQDNHLLIGDSSSPAVVRAPSVAPTTTSTCHTQVKEERPVFSHIPSQVHSEGYSPFCRASSQRLSLQGLGENRSRNGYGRNMTGGQELGKGVIGNVSSGRDKTTVVVTEAGCDIPMIRDPWSALPVFKREDGGEERAPLGMHTISLDPDLPPLAVEHPARVWNSMIHSLSSDLQPVIKWDYEKVNHEEDEKDTFWLAHMTLALPPSHPVIADHPLFRTLPKNRYKKEYVSAVEALGGIKRWTGEPKKLKADAINTTLVRCIADDALAWIRAPNGMRVVTDSDHDGDENMQDEAEQELKERMRAFNQSQATIPAGGPISEEIKIDDEDLELDLPSATTTHDFGEPEDDRVAYQAGHGDQVPQSDLTPLQRFLQILDKTLGASGLDIADSAAFCTDWNPIQNRHGCTLTVGMGARVQTYQEDCVHQSGEDALNAVCQRALQLNVEGFLDWLKDNHESSYAASAAPPDDNDTAHAIIGPITGTAGPVGSGNGALPQITQARALNAFAKPFERRGLQPNGPFEQLQVLCHKTLLHQPGYVEQVLWHEGEPTLVSQIVIGEKTFTITKEKRTTGEARAYLAGKILTEYYGQSSGSG